MPDPSFANPFPFPSSFLADFNPPIQTGGAPVPVRARARPRVPFPPARAHAPSPLPIPFRPAYPPLPPLPSPPLKQAARQFLLEHELDLESRFRQHMRSSGIPPISLSRATGAESAALRSARATRALLRRASPRLAWGGESHLISEHSQLLRDDSHLLRDDSLLLENDSQLVRDNSQLLGRDSHLPGDGSHLPLDDLRPSGDDSQPVRDESHLFGDDSRRTWRGGTFSLGDTSLLRWDPNTVMPSSDYSHLRGSYSHPGTAVNSQPPSLQLGSSQPPHSRPAPRLDPSPEVVYRLFFSLADAAVSGSAAAVSGATALGAADSGSAIPSAASSGASGSGAFNSGASSSGTAASEQYAARPIGAAEGERPGATETRWAAAASQHSQLPHPWPPMRAPDHAASAFNGGAISGAGATSGDVPSSSGGAAISGGAPIPAAASTSGGATALAAGVEEEERVRRDLRALHTRLHGLRLILALTRRDADADAFLPAVLSSFSASLGADLSALSAELGLPAFLPPSVPRQQIEALMPPQLYSSACAAAPGHYSGDCSVCMSELNQDAVVRLLPCLHVFHAECIDPWFARSDFCPNCKGVVIPRGGGDVKAMGGWAAHEGGDVDRGGGRRGRD